MTPSVQVPIDQRFAQLIQQFGLTKNSFAISLGKTASVVQHLIDGRNKPGFDLLCKVFEIYPNVSRDWLLLGKGPMLVGGQPAGAPPVAPAPLLTMRPLESLDLSAIEVPPLRRPAPNGVGSRLQPADIAATLALAAATVPSARLAALQPAEPLETIGSREEPVVAPEPLPLAAAVSREVPIAASPTPPVGAATQPAVSVPSPIGPPTLEPSKPTAPDTYIAAALHAQHLQHQLAVAELRNQHLLEQQQMLREMLAMARQAMV